MKRGKRNGSLQVGDVKIDKFRRDIVVQRVLHVNLVYQVTVFVSNNLADIAILDQRVEIEWVDRAELVDTAHNDHGGLVHLGRASDDPRACRSHQSAVGKNRVRAQDDLVDTGHEREDCGIRDQDNSDAQGDQRFLESLGAQNVVVLGGLSADSGMGRFMVVGIRFGMDHGELALGRSLEQEFLDGS